MARIEGKGLDALTVIHKLVALAWAAATAGLLVSALGAARAGEPFGPEAVPLFAGIAVAGGAGTAAIGAVYGFFSSYGFSRTGPVAWKWGLTVAALAAGWAALGGAFSARGASVLFASQFACFVAAGALGVRLERGRRAAAEERP